MQIRTRVSLLAVLVTLVVGAVIVFAAIQRENLIGKRFSSQIIADQLILWNKIKDGLIDDMEDLAWVVRQNRSLVNALESGGLVEIQRVGRQIKAQFENEPAVDRVDIILPDGTLAYSSHTAVFRSAIVSNAVIEEAFASEQEFRGVGNDKQRNTALVYGAPIYADDGSVLALGILGLDIVSALVELEEINLSSVVIVNRRGRLLASTGDNLWNRFSELIDIAEANNLHTIEDDDRYYSVIVLPQIAELGGLVGRILNIREVTELVQRQQQISRNTAIGVFVFLICAIIGIYLYLAHAFTPLHEGVRVLSALSKGDLRSQIERSTGNDEVGMIANAVNVFRSNLLTLNRIRRSRERQHDRQQRFIFREMQTLADTLDGDERNELLHELHELGNLVEQKTNQKDKQFNSLHHDDADGGPPRDADSLAMLAAAFQSMSNRVQNQHQRLREALATKETLIALRNELNIATRVQQSLLPNNVEISNTYNIWGGMWPAKEVGGDFYDFFPLDDHRIAIAIADVSGKGVPAALFTVMSRTMLHATATFLNSPGRALSLINNFLERNNNEGLFVTVFYGILDLQTGKFKYANGGHNPPIAADSQGVRQLDTTSGLVLAMFRDIVYQDREIDLQPGSRLVMLTDGIPEAFNGDGEAFGDDRLLQTIEILPNQSPEQDVRFIVKTVNDFVGDAPQFDDMACVVLHFKEYMKSKVMNDEVANMGSTATSTELIKEASTLILSVANNLTELARIADEIKTHGKKLNWPNEWIFNVNLSLDELITNIINYGYVAGKDTKNIQLTLSVNQENLVVELVDDGVEFDPFSEAPEPETSAPLDERKIGGLGIFFVKSLVSETRYERKGGKNHTILVLYPPA